MGYNNDTLNGNRQKSIFYSNTGRKIGPFTSLEATSLEMHRPCSSLFSTDIFRKKLCLYDPQKTFKCKIHNETVCD